MAHDYIMRWLQHVKTRLHNAYITIKQIIPSSIRLKLPAPPHWALDFIPCWENGALHTVMYSPGEQTKAASLTSSRFFLTRDSAWIWIAFIFRGGLYRSTQSFHLRRVKPRCHGSHVAWPPAIFFLSITSEYLKENLPRAWEWRIQCPLLYVTPATLFPRCWPSHHGA